MALPEPSQVIVFQKSSVRIHNNRHRRQFIPGLGEASTALQVAYHPPLFREVHLLLESRIRIVIEDAGSSNVVIKEPFHVSASGLQQRNAALSHSPRVKY